MAHPADRPAVDLGEQRIICLIGYIGFAVFPKRRMADLSAEGIGQKLAAIANAEQRNPQGEKFRIAFGSVFSIDIFGAAGQNNSNGRNFFYLFNRRRKGEKFAVNMAFCLLYTSRCV